MKEKVADIIKKAAQKRKIILTSEEIMQHIEIPPSSDLGDFAFPCFFLAGKFKQDPKQIALHLREAIGNSVGEFEEIQTQGPYLNFFVNRKELVYSIISNILKKKDSYGKTDLAKEKIMVEFSQANTHKAFHVGHIRGTSLGESLARIYEFCGNKVIRANYQGDTGMHVAKWIWCYKKFHAKQKIRDDEAWVASIYVDAVKRLTKDEKLQEEVDVINQKLADGKDKELNDLWKKTRKLSLDSFEKIYRELNTKFDVYLFESEAEKDGLGIVDELKNKRIAFEDQGALIVDLKKYNLGVWVLLRKDGTVLYSLKDIALVYKKFNEFKIDRNVYVIGAAQSLHMAQLFKTLELLNFEKIKNCIFVPFSEVRLPTGKMSSRTGENILYSEFIKIVSEFAKKRIKKRNPKISKPELDKRALEISISSIKYAMLKQHPNKNIIFKKEDALNFEGDTGPYLLYSYVRANSILKKSEAKKQGKTSDLEDKEIELAKELSKFPEIVLSAQKSLNPSVIANYSYHLSQVFNEFYHACPVLNSENESFRLSLVEAFKQVLKNSLNLLAIETLDEM